MVAYTIADLTPKEQMATNFLISLAFDFKTRLILLNFPLSFLWLEAQVIVLLILNNDRFSQVLFCYTRLIKKHLKRGHPITPRLNVYSIQ